MKQKRASAREAESRAGNDGPVRLPNHYSIMKDYWGDATGMNNRPHFSIEDQDTITVAAAVVSAEVLDSEADPLQAPTLRTMSSNNSVTSNKRLKRTQGECVEAGLSAVAKGFNEG
ncbi:unnamed protein product [Phytophthora fragariaefolia]|uniref:Unnamed protein product n=1 Tax=Phytophthora fragariaefolia TaxID=1490495 RepID=A0A9W6TVT2_9STRA|nr:unnamed protein product [Phytophthora fragariaefolia]